MLEERKPKTKEKYVGLEIEFSSPIPDWELEEILTKEGLEKICNIGHDGTPSPGHAYSLELKVLIKQKELDVIVPKVFDVLHDIKANVNKSHGIHVHLDCRHRNAGKVYNNLVRAQDLLFKMAAKSRQDNWACERNEHPYLELTEPKKPKCYKKLENWHSDSYHSKCRCYACWKYTQSLMDRDNMDFDPADHHNAISDARHEHNTMEVRIRESTLDGADILNWIKTLIVIADTKLIKKEIQTVSALQRQVKLSVALKRYVATKARKVA